MYLIYERPAGEGDVHCPYLEEMGQLISFEWDDFYKCPFFTVQLAGGEEYLYLCLWLEPYMELMQSLRAAMREHADFVKLRGEVQFLRLIDEQENGAPYSNENLKMEVFSDYYVRNIRKRIYDVERYTLR
ncbi:MAG: hypothetical protein ACI4AD_08030 [Roseburia sp.]